MNEENVADIPQLLLLTCDVSFVFFPITLIISCVFCQETGFCQASNYKMFPLSVEYFHKSFLISYILICKFLSSFSFALCANRVCESGVWGY